MYSGRRHNKRECAASSSEFPTRKRARVSPQADDPLLPVSAALPTQTGAASVREASLPPYTIDADDVERRASIPCPISSPQMKPKRPSRLVPSRLVKPEGFLFNVGNDLGPTGNDVGHNNKAQYTSDPCLANFAKRPSNPPRNDPRCEAQNSGRAPEQPVYALAAYGTPTPAPAPLAPDMSPSDSESVSSTTSSQVGPYQLRARKYWLEDAAAQGCPSSEPPSITQLPPPLSPFPLPISEEGSVDEASPPIAHQVTTVSTRFQIEDSAEASSGERTPERGRMDAASQTVATEYPLEAISAVHLECDSSSCCSDNVTRKRSLSPAPQRMRSAPDYDILQC